MMDTNRKDERINGAKMEGTKSNGGKSEDAGTNKTKSKNLDKNGTEKMVAKIDKGQKGIIQR